MRKYSTALYLFLIGGILVGASFFYKSTLPVLSTSFLILGYAADLAGIYSIIKVSIKK